MLFLLPNVECGRAELVTTDLLSPNKYDFVSIGTPKYLKVFLKSIICSVAVLDATSSDPYVAVSTVACCGTTGHPPIWCQDKEAATSPLKSQLKRKILFIDDWIRISLYQRYAGLHVGTMLSQIHLCRFLLLWYK